MKAEKILERFSWVDHLKGTLILLVMLGHLLPGALDQNWLRYMIYSFHMPLFLALSGFLISARNLRSLSFVQLIKRYFNRMLLAWILALIIYGVINFSSTLTIKTILWQFIYPHYHLWYILALFVMIFMVYALEQAQIRSHLLLLAFFSIFTVI